MGWLHDQNRKLKRRHMEFLPGELRCAEGKRDIHLFMIMTSLIKLEHSTLCKANNVYLNTTSFPLMIQIESDLFKVE